MQDIGVVFQEWFSSWSSAGMASRSDLSQWFDIEEVWLRPENIAVLRRYRVLKRGGRGK